MPKYLREGRKEEKMIRIARFRLKCELRGERYCEEEEKRKCRICGWEEKTWEHLIGRCMRGEEKGGRERILEILDENGRGEEWMKRLQKRRKEEEERGRMKKKDRQMMEGRERERE